MNIDTRVAPRRFLRHPRRTFVLALFLGAGLAAAAAWRRTDANPPPVAIVHRGTLTTELTVAGTLRPIQSLTYRSPVVGRELEVVELAPEGARVNEGDLLVQLDTTELQRDVDRLGQELRQLQADLQAAHSDRQDAEAAVENVTEGEGALTVDEARSTLQLARKKADRLRQEHERLQRLLAPGFITHDQLALATDALWEAEEELALAEKRTEVLLTLTHPRDQHHTALQLAQRNSRLEIIVGRVQEAEIRLKRAQAQLESCRIVARRAGLVVYDLFMNANRSRKIRVGDRVTSSQGLVTIPEVNRMLVAATVGETDVHRVSPGQAAAVHLEGFPELALTGQVIRIGTIARSSLERPADGRRFDVTIELDGDQPQLRPEMTARADIVLSRRDQVLLMPVAAVFEAGGTLVAHVDGGSGVETRRIELGESNTEYAEVLAGLAEHERVIVSEGPTRERLR